MIHVRTSAVPRLLVPLALVSLVLAACADGNEEPSDGAAGGGVCAALEGETITHVVHSDPGGGYDTYARMIAPYLAEALDADVVVENRPGAGGLVAINGLLTVEPDGTTLSAFPAQGILPQVVLGADGPEFTLDDLTYLINIKGLPQMLFVPADSPFDSIDAMRASSEPIKFATAGLGSSQYAGAVLKSEILGLDYDLITQYQSSSDSIVGVISGEADAISTSSHEALALAEAGDLRILVQIADEPSPDVPADVPTILELDLDDRARQLAEQMVQQSQLDRLFVAPAGLPPDIEECLKSTMEAVFTDPELGAEGEEVGLPFDDLLMADEIDPIIADLGQLPEEYAEVLRKAFGAE